MLDKDIITEYLEYKDGNLYWKKPNSNKVKAEQNAGYITKHNYHRVCILGKQYYTHRLVFLMHHGYLPKFIDHIDGNKLNNKIENLREVSHFQNMANVKKKKNNTSGCKCVCFDKSRNKWFVRVTVNKKTYNIGRYKDLELAELVAIEAMHKYHKEYANFN